MRVLGIETSCDETGVAIYDSEAGLIANQLYSQVSHLRYGGVVPELAARDHAQKLLPLVKTTLQQAGLALSAINGIAYTAGPGLIGALLVGAAFARSLAWALGIPAVAVHHMEGHLLAPFLEATQATFPFLALLVSGGHTLLVQVKALGNYVVLGESIDDAAGEAFDKTAKLMNLPYPGGPALAQLAQLGDPERWQFPRPMTDRPGLDFSFSGLKTAAAIAWRSQEPSDQHRANIARAFEDAVVDTLVIKCQRALEQTQLTDLVIAGGVSANLRLREALTKLLQQRGGQAYFPRHEFCMDNGAMIAYAGCQRLLVGQQEALQIQTRNRWSLEELTSLTVVPNLNSTQANSTKA